MFNKFHRQFFSLKTEPTPFKKPTIRSCNMIGLALAMTFAVAFANPIENGGNNSPILLSGGLFITSAKGLGG